MKVVVAGTPEVAIPSLEAIAASSHEIAAVISRPDTRGGRGRQQVTSPVAAWAQARGVPLLQPVNPGDPEFLEALAATGVQCCPVIAYGALLPEAALAVPQHGWVNLHFSLLPAWRGAAPVQRALMAGDEFVGASTFQIERGLDTGPVFGVLTERVRPDDTSGALLDRLATAGAKLLVDTLDGIESGELEAREQSPDGVSLAPKLSVAELRLDWTKSSTVVHRLARAAAPEPGAWAMWRGKRVKIGPLRLPETAFDATDPVPVPPGRLVQTPDGVFVGTASSPLELVTVQPEGKRPMPASDWVRGLRPSADEGFDL